MIDGELAGQRLLLVDDDATTRFVLAEFARRGGAEPVTAADGSEAMARLDSEPFDAVITDLTMPGASGVEVARHARLRNPTAAVVVLTGYVTEALEVKLQTQRVVVLRKPCAPTTILDALSRARALLEAPT